MYQQIDKNKRRSWLLIFAFMLLILGIGALLAYYLEGGEAIFLLAVLFSLGSVGISFYGGDKLILASVGAKQIEKKDDAELFRIVENLAITAGVPTPKVYIMPDEALNAFATGRNPEHASVAITSGLKSKLNKSELEAVMAHELGHVKNYDIRVALLTAVLFGMIVFIADMLWRVSFLGGSRRGRGSAAILPILLIAGILAPIAAQLIKLAISRKRELLADATSVILTRYPDAMITALQKIAQQPQIRGHNEAIAHMFIFPPFKAKSFFSKLFMTHPPIEERIAAIKEGYGIPKDQEYVSR